MKGLKDGAKCTVKAGSHAGKSGIVQDINTSKTGAVTITVLQKNGERFKTLAKNVETVTAHTAKKDSHKSSDWRSVRLSKIRALIKKADPKITEEIKYRKPSNPAGIPVWYRDGMICTGETYAEHLRLTFAKGYKLKDPKKLLNSYRSMVIREKDKLNEPAFKNLIREAVSINQRGAPKKNKKA